MNKGNADFAEARGHSYVDKSGLIAFVNRTLSTPNKMTCVSRARRFGKSLALQMLYAYYDCSCDSRSLFEGLAISRDPSFAEHLNKYYAIHLDITSFITGVSDRDRIVDEMVARVIADIKGEFPDVRYSQWGTLMDVLLDVATQKGRRFVMLIDEWDALCREASDRPHLLEQYISLLRNLFKGDNTNRVFAGVYMTGILPIKSYGTQSALNNFRMYSMTNPEPLEQFFGFTESEVEAIVARDGLTNVTMLPFQPYEDISHVFSLGDVGLVISKPGVGANSVPSKTWSIMSASRPVLANFDPNELQDVMEGTHPFSEEGKPCGIFTKAGDKEAFKAAILHLYENPALCAQMGLSGREFILRNLTKEVGTAKYVEVIRSVVGICGFVKE